MNRAGQYISNMTGEAAYQSFCPAPLPPQPALDISDDILRLLIEASRSLQKLDVASQLIPSTELFVSMYVRKEALLSSQIEGTQCTLEDVLDPELDINANLDVADVVNNVKATQYALELLPQTTRSKDNVRAVFGYLEQHPIIDIKHTAAALSVSYNTVSTAVKKLMGLDILQETTNAARNRVFAYEKHLAILRDGT